MKQYLNTGIKEVIGQYPQVADILNEYDIGCVPCNVGTCLLKDIVKIHNLSPEREAALMSEIGRATSPGGKVAAEASRAKKAKQERNPEEINYSPPIKMLVEEHSLIKRLIALIPKIIERMDLDSQAGRQMVLDVVDFIRSYADRYHHAKEEEILFKYFDGGLDIIRAMHEDHEAGRAHVRAIVEGVNGNDKKTVAFHLKAYGELLTEHIKKEDEILYPWMDRQLTTSQIGEMFAKFAEADAGSGGAQKKYEEYIDQLTRL